MADQLPSDVEAAIKIIGAYVIKTGQSVTSLIGIPGETAAGVRGIHMVMAVIYPMCCMTHAQQDADEFRAKGVERGFIDPEQVPTNQYGQKSAKLTLTPTDPGQRPN